ncbi:response regulator [Frigidibacter oleivorans]|uniref:response regulator n=1 Tax=Frigidibacter oleivorans TaxID=2487129 RepID=UPI001F19D291|nr:response regulator [Frigidibacter oleivorans]
MTESRAADSRALLLHVLIAVLTVAVFAVDLMMPLGSAVWIIYLLPVVAAYLSPRPSVPVLAAAVAILGIGVGFFLDEVAVIGPRVALSNRIMGGLIIGILGTAGYFFVQNRVRLDRSDWLQQSQVALSRAVEGEIDLPELGDRMLAMLAPRLGARAAVAYARDRDSYRRIATYGLAEGAQVPDRFAAGGSHLWRAVAENRVIAMDSLPDTALPYGSALVRGAAAQTVIVPLREDGRVNGVLEFGLDGAPDPDLHLPLLDRIADPAGVAIRSAVYRARVRELLEETRRQAEELRSHTEELAASNEELEEQTRALQDSQARLEQQQAELEEQNAQLESQAQEMESQRDELARSQKLLEDQAAALARESRYKSEFVANMSHELRTPLNALLIMARLLSDNRAGNLTEEQLKWTATIESSGQDLLVLINDILDLAKVEAGKLDMSPERVLPGTVADKLVRAFTPQAQAKRLVLRVEAEEGLPPFVTDPARLEQVLRNFLSNALKFTERGEVVLGVKRGDGGLVFSVRDTGIGIAQSEQDAVFEAFRQADGTISRRYGGTGLGLSISRELAGLLGGRITLQSAEGVGSTLALHLPMEMPQQAASRPAPQRTLPPQPLRRIPAEAKERTLPPVPAGADDPAALSGLAGVEDDRGRLNPDARLILVVEDDPAFARVLVDLTHDLGFQCIVCGTAEGGIAAARQHLPHAIVLDVGLPDHSGLTVLDRLKRDVSTRHIPVHMVSAEDYTKQALEQGALSYLLKPVKREELMQALERLEDRLAQRMRRVLIVEDDPAQLDGLKALLGSKVVETVGAATAGEGLAVLRRGGVDCLVLDMTLPDASGFDLLSALDEDETISFPPVIVYTARALDEAEELRLRRYSKSIIIKGAKSPERLIDEVTLFLHQMVSDLPEQQQRLLAASLNRDAMLEGRRILAVEDDIRNIYALTGVFEPHGATVQIARNGREALEVLGRVADGASPGIDLVLMDVMMPEMDGLTATREIRRQERWKNLPIIMLTAKAMADDQATCLAAGANDYLAKPLDVDKLLSLARVWMPR